MQLPNILSYISYIYFFSGCLIGPAYDFIEYRDFIHKRKLYNNVPFTLVPVIKNILLSCFCMALIVVVAPKYPLEFCGTDGYGALPFYQQFIYLNLAITVARMRYYSGWTMAQAGLDATGFSYGGTSPDGTHSWDNILTADPWLELLASPKEKIDKWNSSVAAWLRRYVYFRIYSEEQIKKSPGLGVLAQNGKSLFLSLCSFTNKEPIWCLRSGMDFMPAITFPSFIGDLSQPWPDTSSRRRCITPSLISRTQCIWL